MANRNIKGITIEIGGDTTKLDKALEGVEKSSKAAKSELRDINKALEKSPESAELWKQKQEVLNKALEASREKLKMLTDSQEQMNAKLRSGEISGEQYRAFQREIANTRAEIESLEGAAQQCSQSMSGIAQAGGKLKEAGDKISGAGKAMLPVTAAIAGVATASTAAYKELKSGYDIIITKTGASGDALESLKEQMDNLFTSIPTTAENAATAIGEVNTRFGLTGDELGNLSEQFIKFAEINGADLNGSIDSVDTVMKKFNLSSEKAGDVLSLLTKVGQDTGLSIGTLTSTLSSNGATMKEMGFDVVQSANLLAMFEKNGVDASTAMAGLSKANQNAVKNGKSLEDELAYEIRAIKIAADDTTALQRATELFGRKGAAEMTQAIREGKISLGDLSAELESYGGVVEDTFAQTQDPFSDAQVAMNSLKIAGAELGTSLMDALAPIISQVVDKIKALAQWFKGLSPQIKQTIIVVGGIVAAIGPVLIVVGKIISAVGTVMTLLPKIKSAIMAVNAVLSANPVGIVIAAIAALVAAFIYLWNNCEEFRNFWINLWEKIKVVFSGFLDNWKLGFEIIKEVFAKIKEKIKEFAENWKSGFEIVKEALTPFIQMFENRINHVKAIMNGIIEFVKNVFTGNWSDAWTAVKTIFSEIFASLADAARTPLNAIIYLLNGAIGGINGMIAKINELSIDIPDWVPGIGGQSISFGLPEIPNIPYLAKGGILKEGSAVVGEAGAELLTVMKGKAIVQPLTSSNSTVSNTSDKRNLTINTTVNVQSISSEIDINNISKRLAEEQTRSLIAAGGW